MIYILSGGLTIGYWTWPTKTNDLPIKNGDVLQDVKGRLIIPVKKHQPRRVLNIAQLKKWENIDAISSIQCLHYIISIMHIANPERIEQQLQS
jgi:hypothetical protein